MTDGPALSPSVKPLLDRCDFPPAGTQVSLAISGGPDSMALLLLAHAAGLVITAIHVDHQLRPNSAKDASIIRAVTDQLGVELVVHTVNVGDGPNLEARARSARYSMFPAEIMTGHTEDDQAETVLINLLRGAGAQGLAAMRPGHSRPLLRIRRTETRALCAEMDIATVNDLTNEDPRFLRNRVRHELLPLMSDISQRDPMPLLARTADVLRADNDLLDELAREIDPTDAKALAIAPRPLAHRAIRQWLADPYPPDLATLERVLAVARGDVLACDVGENRQIRRSKQRLTLHILG
ncbi:MAG: tRNA(Ile)-lysidine synthase [Actinomycetota bacterium]|jgi:tRNA(Ile)-lysidine synthase